MRKLAFYPRLAIGNLWRNRSTYLPYLLACIVSIFTFYTLLAINMNGALDGMRGESVVKSFTAIGTIILGLFCTILIFYTNSFVIKRRKKELGLYSILGMEKKNIGVLMFFETLFIAVIALALGLGLGMLLGKLIFWALLHMVRFPVMMDMPVSPAAIGVTTLFFGAVFLLALLSNLRQVRLANPVNLLAGARQGEREPKASWLLTVFGLLCLGGGYFIALYFQSPIEAIMFFLVAVLLVIIGTYCLFTSASIAMLKLLRRNKSYYYQPHHFISVSGMIYRMKQNAAGLATICILSCMVLVTVSSTVSLNVGAEDSLRTQYPYDAQMYYSTFEEAQESLPVLERIAAESGTALVEPYSYRSVYFMADEVSSGDFVASQDYEGVRLLNSFDLRTLEDYNRNEGTNVQLAPGEALILVTGGSYTRDQLTLGGIAYRLRPIESLGKTNSGSRDIGRTLTLILPDEAAINDIVATFPMGIDKPAMSAMLKFDLAGEIAEKEAFADAYRAYIKETQRPEGHSYRFLSDNRESWYASNGGFLFLGLYFGILFMLAAALIIYYKQMSEGYDDAERFEILQKVGMGEAEVKRTINRQILAVFFLPLIVAIVHVAVAFFPVSRAMVLFGVLNIPLLVIASVLTMLVYAVVYLLVFRRTARTYFRIVRRQTETA